MGCRFLVKDYPKDKEYRRFKLSQQIVRKIEAHVTGNGLGDGDLLFSYQPRCSRGPAPRHIGAPGPG